jgi:hypothetical protein
VGALVITLNRFFYRLAVFLSWLKTHFEKSDALYKDRFASDHEFADLTTLTLPSNSLLLGVNHFSRILHVKATKERRELGNILIPTTLTLGIFSATIESAISASV